MKENNKTLLEDLDMNELIQKKKDEKKKDEEKEKTEDEEQQEQQMEQFIQFEQFVKYQSKAKQRRRQAEEEAAEEAIQEAAHRERQELKRELKNELRVELMQKMQQEQVQRQQQMPKPRAFKDKKFYYQRGKPNNNHNLFQWQPQPQQQQQPPPQYRPLGPFMPVLAGTSRCMSGNGEVEEGEEWETESESEIENGAVLFPVESDPEMNSFSLSDPPPHPAHMLEIATGEKGIESSLPSEQIVLHHPVGEGCAVLALAVPMTGVEPQQVTSTLGISGGTG